MGDKGKLQILTVAKGKGSWLSRAGLYSVADRQVLAYRITCIHRRDTKFVSLVSLPSSDFEKISMYCTPRVLRQTAWVLRWTALVLYMSLIPVFTGTGDPEVCLWTEWAPVSKALAWSTASGSLVSHGSASHLRPWNPKPTEAPTFSRTPVLLMAEMTICPQTRNCIFIKRHWRECELHV